MSIDLLKSLRFITPGIVIFLYWALLGNITGDWKIEVPDSVSDIRSYTPVILAAAFYYLTPIRDWANRKHFDAINKNIRDRLVIIGGGDPDSKSSEWSRLRRLFYKIVDSDASLQLHAKRAYFNGYFWTTTADIKAISMIFSVISLAYYFLFAAQDALLGFVAYSILAVICWPVGFIITRKHKEIGDEQLAIIEQFFKEQVVSYFSKHD